MGLLTLIAVSVLGSDPRDAGSEQGAAVSYGTDVHRGLLAGLVVDTSAVTPPLRVRHGSLDEEKIREVVSSHQAALRSCYQRAVLENPLLSGTCTVRIVIAKDGAVGTASMRGSSLRSLSMERCVLQLVRTWRFPPPAEARAAAVEYPLVFRKQEPDAGL